MVYKLAASGEHLFGAMPYTAVCKTIAAFDIFASQGTCLPHADNNTDLIGVELGTGREFEAPTIGQLLHAWHFQFVL